MRPSAHTASHIPGRIRLRIPAAKHDAQLMEEIARDFAALSGVEGVQLNLRTGSLLIHYAAELYRDIENILTERGKTTRQFSLEQPQLRRSSRRPSHKNSELGKAIAAIFATIDDEIRYATDNQLDLKVLLPLIAMALGLTTVRRSESRATPLWLTLGIFAFSSFLSLHGTMESPAEQAAEEPLMLNGLAQ